MSRTNSQMPLAEMFRISGFEVLLPTDDDLISLFPNDFVATVSFTRWLGVTHLEYLHFYLDPSVESFLFSLKIVPGLQIQPKSLGELEITGKAKGRVCTD